MNKIVPNAFLKLCPICNSSLKLNNDLNGEMSTCSKCEYQEPSGSALVVTYLSACLTEYSANLEVDTVFLKDNEFTIKECMEGNGLLPLFIERTQQILAAAGLGNVKGVSLPFKVIEDVKGLLMSRVVIDSGSFNFATAMSFIVESIHETISLTHSMDTKYYGNQMCLDYMPCVNPLIDVSGSNNSKLRTALELAVKAQSIGVSNGN